MTPVHQFPLQPIKSMPGWYRCRRCWRTFSEPHPTTNAQQPCVPVVRKPR